MSAAALVRVPGVLPWALLVALATAAALALEAGETVLTPRVRATRALAIVALATAGLWALALAWGPPGFERRFVLQSVAWWLLVLPAWALGTAVATVQGPAAVARLAAAQAAPAVFLSFASIPAVAPLASMSAGFLRAAAPPLHPLVLEAADALPAGAVGLLVLVGLVLGGPPAAQGALALPAPLAGGLAIAVAAAAGVAGLAAPRDPHLLRRLATWASVQAGLAVVIALQPEWTPGRSSLALATAHLGATAAALPLLFLVLGRLVAFARTDDMAAYAGLLSVSLLRGQAVLLACLVAVAAGAQAPVALAQAALAQGGGLARAALFLGIAGWVGTGLALVLAGYRIVRGTRVAPGGEPPDVGRGEALLIALLLAAVVAAVLFPSAWAPPSL